MTIDFHSQLINLKIVKNSTVVGWIRNKHPALKRPKVNVVSILYPVQKNVLWCFARYFCKSSEWIHGWEVLEESLFEIHRPKTHRAIFFFWDLNARMGRWLRADWIFLSPISLPSLIALSSAFLIGPKSLPIRAIRNTSRIDPIR